MPQTGVQNNGPRVGNTDRNRNTVTNNASKAVYAPLLSPTATYGFATGVAGLQTSLAGTLAALRAQAAAAKGRFIAERAGIKAQRIEDTAAAVNNALERGAVGSSVDLAGRSKAVTDAAAALVAARGDKAATLAALKAEGISATGDFYLGLSQLESQQALQQSELAIQNFQADAFDAMQQNFAAIRAAVLQRLRANGRLRPPAGVRVAPGDTYETGPGRAI